MATDGARPPVFDVSLWCRKKGRNPPQPHVSQPYQVGCWSKESIKDGREIKYGDTSGLMEFRMPKLPADLNEGFPDSFIRKPAGDHSPVEQVASALAREGIPWGDADVVTFRNNLNKIFMTPHNQRDSWVVHGCLLNQGPLFLDIHHRPGDEGDTYPDADRFTYFGFKFEQLCTDPAGPGPDPPPVDSTSEFAAVVRLRIGKLRIMMGAEMDCHLKGQCTNPKMPSYLELKTFKTPAHRGQLNSLKRFKYPRWWLQSWLAGVPSIGIGERDEPGTLLNVKIVRTTDLPAMSDSMWDPWEFISFGEAALSWMQDTARASRGRHLRFTYSPTSRLITASEDEAGDLASRVAAILAGAQS